MNPRSFPWLADDRAALVRITGTAHAQLETLLFQRHPDREWGTFFTFGYRRTSWGIAISYVEALAPTHGELNRRSSIVSFNPDYISRMLDVRDRTRLGVGFIHSHPKGWGVTPSPSDDDMDVYFVRLSAAYGSGQPYVSLIANTCPDGRFEFSGRAFDKGEWLPVTTLYTAGARLGRYRNTLLPTLSSLRHNGSEDTLSRWEALVGPQVRDYFANATVGVIGCSGTGSPAIEALARALIGQFVVVDGQRVGPSNLERMHGSRASDLNGAPPPYKVEIMARLIREINPAANIVAFVGNALDDDVIDALLQCDFILGCTDSQHGRALLGDLASIYLVPALDVGVLPRAKNGRITAQIIDVIRLGTEDPCPFCHGRISVPELNVELMSDDERERCRAAAQAAARRGQDGSLYWAGELPQLPSVGYLTTIAGAMVAGYALNWLLGTAEMPHSRFQFDLNSPEFAFVADATTPRSECACVKCRGHGDQGDRSVTRPLHFPHAKRVI